MRPGDVVEKAASREIPEPARTPLDRLVDDIRSDAADRPEPYARDAIVPGGGE